MRAIKLIVIGLCVMYVAVSYFKQSTREALVREHRFNLTMPADDVRRSLGEPLKVVSTGPASATWIYPLVSINFSHGKVTGSHAIAPATPGQMRSQNPGNLIATRESLVNPHPRELQPVASKEPSLGVGGGAPRTARSTPRSLLDQPAHR